MLKTSRTQALLNSTSITRIARSTLIAVAGIMATASPALAIDDNALPTGGNVASGSADFNYHDNAPQLDINQHSDRVVIDWNSFDIGKNATTQFNQNSANAIAVNRVHDVNPSQILGALRANGKVVVLNTNGVFFGAGAKVDVAGLLVSTGELDAQLFQSSGQVKLSNINANPNAKIENQGQITIRNSGLAAFVAPEVANSGVIEAHLGKIALASGADKATVDMYGDGLVELALDDKASKAVISNTGKLKADGGKIAITATAAKDVVDSVINMDGIVEANAVGVKNGVITLGATNADIKVSGKIGAQGGNGKITAKSNRNIRVTETAEINADAGEVGNGGTVDLIADKNMAFFGKVSSRGGSVSGNGGNVEISGYKSLGFNGVVDLSAANGNRGSLLLDPSFAIIHNGSIPAGWLQDYIISAEKLAYTMRTANVTVQADNFIDVGTKKGGYTNLGWTGIAVLDAAITAGLNALSDGAIDVSTWSHTYWGQTGSIHIGFGIYLPTYGWITDSGTTQGNLTLQSNTVNFNRDLKMGNGNVVVDANTVNLDARLYDVNGVTTLGDARISSNADLVNVISNDALIQQGIYLADDAGGATVNVAAGTYDESVEIKKSLKLKGANAGKAGTDATRGAETIIRAVDDFGVDIQANDVTLDGLTVDLTNNGTSSDYAVLGYNANNLKVQNNIITGANFGVFLYGTGSTNSLIEHNKLHNIHGVNGQAIHIRDNAYADILNNNISDADVGITTENFSQANTTGTTSTISGNVISAGKIGIRNNLSYGTQTGFIIQDNTITAENPAEARRWTGIDVISQQGGVATVFKNNNIDGSGAGARQSAGYEFTNMTNASRAVVDGGSVKNVGVGVWATDGSFYTGAVNDLLIKNVAFSDISETGILVEDTEGNTGVNATGTKVTIGSGNTFTNTPYDLTIAGDGVTVALDAGFDGVSKTFVKAAGPARYSASGLTTNNASINTGIGATAAGGSVYVDNGTFTENVVLNKGLTLRSLNGRDFTTIQGIAKDPNGFALGTVVITDGVNNANLGLTGHGFNIVGFDNEIPGIENAAVYVQGAHDNLKIQGNKIVADGDLALLTEWTAINSNLTIDGNSFDGKTYQGATWATGDQFTVPNVARQLIALGTMTSNLIFTNNEVKGDAGNNYVATLHSAGGLIEGNTFDALSTAGALRVRGSDMNVTNNVIDGNGGGFGIYADKVNNLTINDNDIDNTGGHAINVIAATGTSSVTNNRIGQLGGVGNIKGDGIYSQWGTGSLNVEGNKIKHATGNGINLEGSTNTQTVTSNEVFNVDGHGVRLWNTNGTQVRGNIVSAAGGAGLYVDGSQAVLAQLNVINGTGSYGILAKDGLSGFTADLNWIDNTGADGIRVENIQNIYGSMGNVISKNSIGTVGGTNNIKGDGIYVGSTNNAKIKGNTIAETHSTAFDIGSGIQVVNSSGAVIGGAGADRNTITNSGWDGIRLASVSNVTVENNSIDNVERVGIYGGNVNTVAIKDNIVKNDHLGGYGSIHADGGSNWTVSGNDIDFGDFGIRLNSTSGTNLVDNNQIDNVTQDGVYIGAASNVTVSNNKIGKNGGNIGNNGISIIDSANAQVRVNEIVGGINGVYVLDSNGVWVGNTGAGQANKITGSQTGVRVENSADVRVTNNDITNTQKGIFADKAKNFWAYNNDIVNAFDVGIHVTNSAGTKYGGGTGSDVDIWQNRITSGVNAIGILIENSAYATVGAHENNQFGNPDGYSTGNVITGGKDGIVIKNSNNSMTRYNTVSNVGVNAIQINGGNAVNVWDNKLTNIGWDGIQFNTSTNGLIKKNTITNVTGASGIAAMYGSNGTVIDNNIINGTDRLGIYAWNSNGLQIKNNDINDTGREGGGNWFLSGIHLEGVNNTTVEGNLIRNTAGDAIHVGGQGNQAVQATSGNVIKNNVIGFTTLGATTSAGINNIKGDGIFADKSDVLLIEGNKITTAGGSGIKLSNANGVRIQDNLIDAAKYGVHLGTGNDNDIITPTTTVLLNNTFSSTLDGAMFESGNIDLQGTNIFKFTRDGLVFDGAKVSLVGNTFGTTVLTDTDNVDNTNSYFIRLANGALFDTDQPTILDATQVEFNDDVFTNFVPNSFILPFATYTALENRLFDFDDQNTLGQIFFTYPGGADINDILPQQFLAGLNANAVGSVTILGLPYANNTVPNFANLANIETAAGGEPNTAGDPNALNDIDTAAGGETQQAQCWNQVYSSLSGTAAPVTYSLDTSPASLLSAQQSCGTTGI